MRCEYDEDGKPSHKTRETSDANGRWSDPYSQWCYHVLQARPSIWLPSAVISPESRYITTFATHKGLWRYTRLNFGTNSASEIFQKIIQDQLRNVPGALNISDDVIVFGKTQADHDAALEAVCQKFAEVNLTLNRKKCEFNKSSLTFFGFVFSGKGIMPNPKKVEAIKNAPAPTTASGVRSFLGMATYCAKFIPKFSDVSAPLRELIKKDKQFHWSELEERSFQQIKELLTSAKVMAYFDPSKETELITDASHATELSAILMQNPQTQLTDELLRTLAEHSALSNTNTHKPKKKPSPSYEQLRSYTFTCMEAISNSSQIVNLYSSSSATQSPHLQQESSVGTSVFRAIISRQYTPKEVKTPQTTSHVMLYMKTQGKRHWQRSMYTF